MLLFWRQPLNLVLPCTTMGYLTNNNQLLSLIKYLFPAQCLVFGGSCSFVSYLLSCSWEVVVRNHRLHILIELKSEFPASLHQAGIPALLSHQSVLPSQLRASTNTQYLKNADALPRRHAGSKNRNVHHSVSAILIYSVCLIILNANQQVRIIKKKKKWKEN